MKMFFSGQPVLPWLVQFNAISKLRVNLPEKSTLKSFINIAVITA
jgi:hypothetical protein